MFLFVKFPEDVRIVCWERIVFNDKMIIVNVIVHTEKKVIFTRTLSFICWFRHPTIGVLLNIFTSSNFFNNSFQITFCYAINRQFSNKKFVLTSRVTSIEFVKSIVAFFFSRRWLILDYFYRNFDSSRICDCITHKTKVC